jgi:NDP-sugar pyrophosphorylase family protein
VSFARNRAQSLNPRSSIQERLCIYTGVQILEPEVLDWIPPGASDSVNDIYPRLIGRGYPVRGFVSNSYWCECSTPERYLTKSLEVLGLRNKENLSLVELPQGCRGAIVGDNVHVPPDTLVEKSVLWGDIKLGARSSFRGVIITDGVGELPADTHLQDAIVTPIEEGQKEFRTVTTISARALSI